MPAPERCAGVSYYRWLRELEQNFDARADELIETLRTLCEKLFVTARMRLSITGGRQNAEPVLTGPARSASDRRCTRRAVSGAAAADP